MTLFTGNSTVNSSINPTTASIGANSTTTSLFVAANGNVGINTSSPSQKLHISGTDATIRIDGTGSSVSSIQLNPTATAGYFGTISNFPLSFVTGAGGTEKMRITASGDVGIGTTTPASKLQVVGSTWIGGSNNSQSAIALYSQSATTAVIEAFDPTNSATKRDIGISAFGGNVGIGTQSPSQKLTVSGIGNATGDFRAPIFYDSDNTAYYVNLNDWTKIAGLWTDWGAITFQSTQHKRITSNDGAGNWNFRAGNYMDGTLKYINNGANSGAATITFSCDSADGAITLFCAPIGVSGANVTYTASAGLDRYGSFGASGDLRAPIFYDTNNTAYYTDPNGTSVLTRVSLWSGTTSALHVNDVAGASSFNYVMSAANDTGTKLVAFVNGSTRNADGGNNAVVIRNDGGPFVLGSTSQITTVAGSHVGVPTDIIISGGVDAIQFNNATSNYMLWNSAGTAAPAFTTRSAGTKLVLFPQINATNVDYALGIETNTLWSSVPTTSQQFKWYGGTTLAMTLSGSGTLTLVNSTISNLNATTLATFATAATASEGKLIANFSGQNPAYLFNNSTYWGLYSASGDGIITYNRSLARGELGAPYTIANGSMRAPIFYDSDDTISRWTSNDFVLRGTSPTIFLRDTDHNSAMIHVNSNTFHILRGGNDTETWTQVNSQWPLTINLTNNDAVFGGALSIVGATYSPLYYDRDNTAYYFDGAGYTVVNGLTVYGAANASSSQNQLFLWNSGGTTSAIGFKQVTGIWAEYGTTGGYNTYFSMDSAGRGWVFRRVTNVGSDFTGTNIASIVNDGTIYAAASMRTPIFYDSNNTGFYTDPAGTSVLNVQKSWWTPYNDNWHNSNDGKNRFFFGTNGRTYYGSQDGFEFRSAADVNIGFLANDGNHYNYTSVRSPIFYDNNNTGYYTDPASTSVLNAASFAGTMTLPTGGGTNEIKAGTGDGASFTTYNLAIRSWFGIGFRDHTDSTTVKAYIDCRSGHLGLAGNANVGGNLTVTGTGGRTLIATLTASNSATLSTTALSGYRYYEIIFTNIVPVTTSTILQLRWYASAAYQTTGYQNYIAIFNGGGSASYQPTTYVDLSGGGRVSSTASNGYTGRVLLTNADQATGFKQYIIDSGGLDSTTAGYNRCWGTGQLNVTAAITGFQMFMSSGNISTGRVEIWGWN